MLGAIAGGGLTAAGLSGAFSNGALAAEPAPSEPVTPTSSEPATPAPSEPVTEPPSTTSTTAPTTTTPPSTTVPVPAPTPQAPKVSLPRQKTVKPKASNPQKTSTPTKANKATGPNNVAASPQAVAQAGAIAAMLASSQASVQALGFYRIPLFLLPIYKAAAVQYGVPWQILAAINEIETNYGSDLSISTAGAEGWMQFMPETWLQYGVDALNAGYADPYNPVDAIFAAARYLRAAGAASNLRRAILAYNHSEEYADSVLLRARLISAYPKGVIATLTGLVDGRLPVTGGKVAWTSLPPEPASASSATAGASAVPGSSATPGSAAAPSPGAAAANARHGGSAQQPMQLIDLTSVANAQVVAVQDGRVIQMGVSRRLGRFLVLRDVYGDVFTYAGIGSFAPTYTPSKTPSAKKASSPALEAAGRHDPAPSLPASAGTQSPLTLKVKTPAKSPPAGQTSVVAPPEEQGLPGTGKARLYAHPGNPDAQAAAKAASAARRARRTQAGTHVPLRKGSVVASGTVLGKVGVPHGATHGHLRFAIRPAGDASTIDPGPILANWAQLQRALHPQGAKAGNALLGATASDVFLLPKSQLERTVLSDPAITMPACARHDIATGAADRRILALLAFLSRSGLKPTVGALRCGASQASAATHRGLTADITAINGTPIAHHQGSGTITDLTIRTLLTLPAEFVPAGIVSLMRYPGAANTHADPHYWSHIHLEFQPAVATVPAPPTTGSAHSAHPGKTAAAPLITTSPLSPTQWTQLITRVAGIPAPHVATKPSAGAIADPKHH